MLISGSAEALQLIAKDDFSMEDARLVFLYLVQRDEHWRRSNEIFKTGFFAIAQGLNPVLLSLLHMPLPPSTDPDVHRQLQKGFAEAVDAINRFVALMKAESDPDPDSSLVH